VGRTKGTAAQRPIDEKNVRWKSGGTGETRLTSAQECFDVSIAESQGWESKILPVSGVKAERGIAIMK
jgi:hypothetical protein